MKSLVLVVEDDPDILETLQSALERRGYQVIAAVHGRDAFDRTKAGGVRPALVLLDVRMPVMDGETFLRLQSSEPLLAGVPVIIMTAEHYQPELMAPTVRAFLEKPVALSVVLEMVNFECRSPRSRSTTLGGGDGGHS